MKKDITNMVRILVDSTCTFMATRIYNEKNRFAYVRAMSRCLAICTDKAYRNDVSRMRTELLKIRRESLKSLRRRFEVFSSTNKYYMLGINQSIEIVGSIHTRFEKGYSCSDEYFVRSILGNKHDIQT